MGFIIGSHIVDAVRGVPCQNTEGGCKYIQADVRGRLVDEVFKLPCNHLICRVCLSKQLGASCSEWLACPKAKCGHQVKVAPLTEDLEFPHQDDLFREMNEEPIVVYCKEALAILKKLYDGSVLIEENRGELPMDIVMMNRVDLRGFYNTVAAQFPTADPNKKMLVTPEQLRNDLIDEVVLSFENNQEMIEYTNMVEYIYEGNEWPDGYEELKEMDEELTKVLKWWKSTIIPRLVGRLADRHVRRFGRFNVADW